MKKGKLLYILIFFAVTFSSCEEWLDVSPKADVKADVFYTYESGYRDALIGVYSLMSTTKSYGRELSYTFLDVLAQYYDETDGVYGYGNFKFAANYEWSSSKEETRLLNIWSTAYQSIANVNLALRYIDDNKSVFSNDAVYKVYKGEFLALRAYLHFDMLRLFAPSPANGLTAKSIPYTDEYTSEAKPQLSISDAIDKIVKDLNEAKVLMEEYDPYGPNSESIGDDVPEALKKRNFRLNYYGVVALLARVHSYVGNKQLAIANATILTGKADGSISIPDVFELTVNPADKSDQLFRKELIFSLDKGVKVLEEETKPYFFNEEDDYYRQNVLSLTTERKNTIYEGGASFRNAWISATADGAKYSLSKYKDQGVLPLLKLSEMFLIAAESSEVPADALWYLNKIRAHRGLTGITEASKLQEEIYKEYRREFIGEGQLFYFYKKNLYSTIGSADDVEIDVNKAYTIPLPKSELEFGNYN